MPHGFPNFRHDPTVDPHAALRQKLQQQAQQKGQEQKPASSAASISSERPLLSDSKDSASPAPKKSVLKEMVQAVKPKQR